MKCVKILDKPNVQGFSIKKPTRKFKKLFPKKYILVIPEFDANNANDIAGQTYLQTASEMYKTGVMNISALYEDLFTSGVTMFIFTYADKLPRMVSKWMKEGEASIQESVDMVKKTGKLTPMGLLDYIYEGNVDVDPDTQADTREINCILKCFPMTDIVPATFNSSVVIRCNAEMLMGKDKDPKKMKKRLISALENYLGWRSNDMTVEKFVTDICLNGAWNEYGFPIRFPKTIDEKYFDNFGANGTGEVGDFGIGYDIVMNNPNDEVEFICLLEDAFEDMNEKIVIYDNYNGFIDVVRKYMDKNKLKYRVYSEIEGKIMAIECKKRDIRKVEKEGGWLITDMLA